MKIISAILPHLLALARYVHVYVPACLCFWQETACFMQVPGVAHFDLPCSAGSLLLEEAETSNSDEGPHIVSHNLISWR